MTGRSVPMAWSLVLIFLPLVLCGCRFDFSYFFDVNRSATDVCDIRPEGEFCEPDLLPPDENEGWVVERQGEVVRVYAHEAIWVANEDPDDDTKLKAKKVEVLTSDPGPCTTQRERTLSLTVTFEALKGKLNDATRIEGGEDCGPTPRGQRISYQLDGENVGSP
jgi:hypothetical protein